MGAGKQGTEAVWRPGDEAQRKAVEMLFAALASIGSNWPAWRLQRLADEEWMADLTDADVEVPVRDDVAEALDLAQQTGHDGVRRVLDRAAEDLESLQELRLAAREAICATPDGSPTRHVLPWLWDGSTSGGKALTGPGRESGFEMRLSRYNKPVC